MKFKLGQIVFFNWDNIGSRFIHMFNRMAYGSKGFAHVGIITRIEKNRIQIHEAINKGTVRSWYGNGFIEEKIKDNTIEIFDVKKKLVHVESCANQYLGRPYAWFDIVGIGISFLTGWRLSEITGAKHLICSEAVSRILYDASFKKINLSEEFGKPYDLITPMDLYCSDYFKKIKW